MPRFRRPSLRVPVASLGTLLAAGAAAQKPAPLEELRHMPSGVPDLTGVWQALDEAHWNIEPHAAMHGTVASLGAQNAVPAGVGVVEGGVIPYRPEAKAQRDANSANRETLDREIKCYRPGVPRATYMPYPFGDSRGRYEGEALVIETTHFTGKTNIRGMPPGALLSPDARVTERFERVDDDTLLYRATVEDPFNWAVPWTIEYPLARIEGPDVRVRLSRRQLRAREYAVGRARRGARGGRGGQEGCRRE